MLLILLVLQCFLYKKKCIVEDKMHLIPYQMKILLFFLVVQEDGKQLIVFILMQQDQGLICGRTSWIRHLILPISPRLTRNPALPFTFFGDLPKPLHFYQSATVNSHHPNSLFTFVRDTSPSSGNMPDPLTRSFPGPRNLQIKQ